MDSTSIAGTSLESLIEEITFRRRKDLRRNGDIGGGGGGSSTSFSVNHNTTYWTDLFVRHFLFQTEYEVDRDDLLFFIRKNLPSGRSGNFAVEVFRRDSRKLPIGDPDVDWEETIYLNLIVHQLNYKVTLAVCSRTSPKNLQVLKRFSQKVWATPSRRKMESKGESEEMTYPHISFAVDNYDEMFNDVVVRDGESVGIELTASDQAGNINVVLFSASVPYEAMRRVYDARASQTVRKRLSQTNLFSLFSGGKHGTARVEYVRLVGPQGHSELAVSKTKDESNCYNNYYSSPSGYNNGSETPCSEPGGDIFDLMGDSDTEDFSNPPPDLIGFKKGHHRRLSDPSSTLNDFMRIGILDRPSGGKSRYVYNPTIEINSVNPPFVQIDVRERESGLPRRGHVRDLRRRPAGRVRGDQVQPAVDDARLHSDLPLVARVEADAERAGRRLRHLRHSPVVVNHQRCARDQVQEAAASHLLNSRSPRERHPIRKETRFSVPNYSPHMYTTCSRFLLYHTSLVGRLYPYSSAVSAPS